MLLSLKKLLNNRKWLLVAGSIMLLAVLTGCTSMETMTEDQLRSGNFWERNVVLYFTLALNTFADWFNGEYVLAILLLTIIVRTAILPLTIKQMRSSKEMQKLQPKLLELKKKYKDNPQKQQEETVKLFQQHNVNPMAGCLPILIQMPVFIALYNAIYLNDEIRHHTFLWLQLGEPDKWVLPILAALTTFIQSKMMMSQQPAQPAMQFMTLVFPVLIFIMSMQFPAALPLYWVFSNIYTIVQNFFLYRNKDKEVQPAK
ncbi:YidC/Oxa1 family membrane protein insertase [Paenibacillus agilis]|uniref:Membrane protein insertase YidC n=1 Tax=Paenibacillus agilis TaxID=3020863 RepID=A0A559IQF1_9BACL|nr:YidC/Oxa1 family membrane protein insertase [Paenibacillus agilis]TVX89820.1 membrane protein insertase YidC [Paenibacillus agilis]